MITHAPALHLIVAAITLVQMRATRAAEGPARKA